MGKKMSGAANNNNNNDEEEEEQASPSFLLHTRSQAGLLHHVEFSRDGKFLATSSNGERQNGVDVEIGQLIHDPDCIILRDAEHGNEITKLRGCSTADNISPRTKRVPLCFSPDSKFLFTINSNFKKKKNIMVDVLVSYQLDSCSGEFYHHEFDERHRAEIVDVSVSCDNRFVAAASVDGTFSVYSLKTKACIGQVSGGTQKKKKYQRHRQQQTDFFPVEIHRAQFFPDIPNLLIVAGDIQYFKIYKINDNNLNLAKKVNKATTAAAAAAAASSGNSGGDNNEEKSAAAREEEDQEQEEEEDFDIQLVARLARYDKSYQDNGSTYQFLVQNDIYNNIVWGRTRNRVSTESPMFSFLSPVWNHPSTSSSTTQFRRAGGNQSYCIRYYAYSNTTLDWLTAMQLSTDKKKKQIHDDDDDAEEAEAFPLTSAGIQQLCPNFGFNDSSVIVNFALTRCGSSIVIGGWKREKAFQSHYQPITICDVDTEIVIQSFYFHETPISCLAVDWYGSGQIVSCSLENDWNSILIWGDPLLWRFKRVWRNICLIKTFGGTKMKECLDAYVTYCSVGAYLPVFEPSEIENRRRIKK